MPLSKMAKKRGADVQNHNSWFKIEDYDTLCEDDIELSVDQVMKILEQEIKLLGGRSRRVFIGGFNQGAIIAFSTFIKYSKDVLGGCFMVNGTALLDIDWKKVDINQKKKSTIFFYHTKGDDMISHQRCEIAYTKLQ
jgi:predicted esterase